MSAGAVTVDVAQPQERQVIRGLLQFYFYDFSELEPAGSANMDFNPEGTYTFSDLHEYWGEAGHVSLIIRRDGKLVGFALLNQHSHLDGGHVERNMAEFFVARKHRRLGVASEAVRRIVADYPGRWEVAVMARNPAAQAFWPRAILAAPNVSELVLHDGDGAHWTGPIWSFVAS